MIMGFLYGFQKWVSTDIFWMNTTLWSYTLRVIFTLRVIWICHTWIKDAGHSKITLLLQLKYGLQNSFINT